MRLRILLFFFIVAGHIGNVCWAQQSEFLYGKVIDAKTKEPIPFATIRILNKAVGVISNDDGGFVIPLKFKEIGEILEISSMGFGAQKIFISALASDQINLIMLLPKAIELQEVTVAAKKRRKLTAFEIVKKSIAAIPGNYPMKSFSTVGYYREYQKKGNRYINLNEAILGVFDEGFNTSDNEFTAVRIYDYRENRDFERDTIALEPYNYINGIKVIDKAFLWNYGGNEFT
ncbi:carboxypeptidase-like regulatory domain-containing protein, partial [uncultured Eudoraea sp.]|uniref:carboxypeptidase-like regulatory domain-containing protein n=1 Tax=uncultured Eudoraea sp. TaxID=1035614 RepID=UPI002631BF84